MPIIATKTKIKVNYLVTDEQGIATSTHPVEADCELTTDGFIQALNDILQAKQNIQVNKDEVKSLFTAGNIVSLGNIQASTLGIQQVYDLPTTVGTAGQAIAYVGAYGLQWSNTGGAQGNQGTQGFQGLQGNLGLQGLALVGALTARYKFDTATDVTAPASGYLKFNSNVGFANVTQMRINVTDRNGNNYSSIFGDVKYFYIYSEADPNNKFVIFLNSGYDGSSYYTVTRYSSKGSLFTNNENIGFAFSIMGRTGYQGPQGFQGSTGPTGFIGLRGFQGRIGNTGFDGNQGSQGFQGAVGAQGLAGQCQGPQGTGGGTL